MVQKGRAGRAEEASELGPGIRARSYRPRELLRREAAAVRSPYGLGVSPVWTQRQNRRSAVIRKCWYKRVGGNGHLDPFAPAGDDRQRRRSGVGHPHVVLELSHMLFGSRLFGERPRQHELGFEYGVEIVDEPVQGRRQVPMDRVPNPALNVRYGPPSIALVPSPVQRLGGDAELDDEIVAADPPARPRPRFSFQSRISAGSSGLMMIRASEPPRNCRRFGSCDRRAVIGSDEFEVHWIPLDSTAWL